MNNFSLEKLTTTGNIIKIDEDSIIKLNIIITVVLSIIDFITFSGNLLVIIAIISTKTLHTITNLFILSLAVADLLVSILVMPLSIITITLNHKWYFGKIICDLYISSDIMLCTASILNLCCISLDRYFAITRPLAYCRKRSSNLARKMIALVWVGSILITCPPVFGWNDENRSINNCSLNTLLSYRIFSSTGSFFLPCTVMIFVYLRIFKVINEREKYLMKNSANFIKFSSSLQNYQKKNQPLDKSESYCHLSENNKTFSQEYCNRKNVVHKFGKTLLTNNSSFNSNCSKTSINNAKKYTENFSKIKTKRFSCLDESPENSHINKKSNENVNEIEKTPLKNKSKSKSYNDLLLMNTINSGSMINNQCQKINKIQKLDDNNQIRHSSMRSKFIELNEKSSDRKNIHVNQHQKLGKTCGSINSTKLLFDQKKNLDKSDSLNTNSSLTSMHMIKKSASFSQLKSKKGNLKHSSSNTEQQIGLLKESKAAKTLSVLVGSFILAWGPFFIMYIIEVIFPNLISIELADIITWIGYLNSTFNPIIYAWYSQQFRDAFYRLTINKIKTSKN